MTALYAAVFLFFVLVLYIVWDIGWFLFVHRMRRTAVGQVFIGVSRRIAAKASGIKRLVMVLRDEGKPK